MTQLIAYMANRRDRLGDVLRYETCTSQAVQLHEPGSWGLGYYQNGEVLHRKQPLSSDKSVSWAEQTRDVISDAVVACIEDRPEGSFSADNVQPFRMRNWLFAYAGELPVFAHLQERALSDMDGMIRQSMSGNSVGECLFGMLLSRLHQSNQIDLPEISVEVVLSALASLTQWLEGQAREYQTAVGQYSLMLTNGHRSYLVQQGLPSFYRSEELEGHLRDEDKRWLPPSYLRYVIAWTGMTTPLQTQENAQHYSLIGDGHVLIVDRQLQTDVRSLVS